MTIGETVTLEALERDPYPVYARLRDDEPVSFVPAVGLWLVTRYDDVKRVATGPETFTAATEPSTLNRTMGENMLGMEGPEQRWIRSITEVPFRPRDVQERTQGMIPRLADELLDGLVARGEADLFREYADPMSVRSLCFMLGLDDVPWQDILTWNEGLMPGLANFEGDPAKQAPADEAAAALHAAIGDVLDRLASEPDSSVLSWMLHHEEDGRRMSRDQIVANTTLMLSGGLQEPRDVIALTLWALLSNRSQYEETRERSFAREGGGRGDAAVGGPGRHGDASDDARCRTRRCRARSGCLDRRRALVGESRPTSMDRSGSVRHPPQGRGPPRILGRHAFLPRGVVRPAPRAGHARPRAGSPSRAEPDTREARHAGRMGVPRARLALGQMASIMRGVRH